MAEVDLIAACELAMWAGIAAATAGGRLGDISCRDRAVGAIVRPRIDGRRYGSVDGYGGHGIGTAMHMAPFVANQGKRGKGPRLAPGTALAIEPMVTLGRPATRQLADGWTVVTKDGARSAHAEHSIAISEDGICVLTAADGGAGRPGPVRRHPDLAGLTWLTAAGASPCPEVRPDQSEPLAGRGAVRRRGPPDRSSSWSRCCSVPHPGLGYANKARCVGPAFDSQGRSEPDYGVRISRDVCYSDIQYLWIGRDIDRARLPLCPRRLQPGSGTAFGGARGVSGADRDGDLAGRAAVGHRRRLPVRGPRCCWPSPACCPPRCWPGWPGCAPGGSRWRRRWCCTPSTTGTCSRCAPTRAACWVLLRAGRAARPERAWSRPAGPLIGAAVLLGVGAAFKLYPMMFALPIACGWAAGGWRPGAGRTCAPAGRRWLVGGGLPGRHRRGVRC